MVVVSPGSAAAVRRQPGRHVRFSVLGPLAATDGEAALDLGPYQQRVLLAALLCRANTVLSLDQLLDVIWAGKRPRTARKNLQVYVSALRKLTGHRIDHHAYGYLLRATEEDVDLLRFDRLAAEGRNAERGGDRAAAHSLLGRAVRLWRDHPLVDLLGNPFLAAESDRLVERCLGVFEDWVDLEIDAGGHLGVLDRVVDLAHRHPFRERLTTAAMTALFRSGGRREALGRYETHRQFIARELGLDPSPVLQRLYQEILAGAPVEPARGAAPAYRGPARLPRDLPDFVGRAEPVRTLTAALSGGVHDTDLTIVSGVPGAGKTALAVHVGQLLADQFPDGQLLVSLREENGEPRLWRAVLADLLRGTGLDSPLPAEDTAARNLWRSWVADLRLLFVLDDASCELCVRQLLPGLGPSRTLVTATGRLSALESAQRLELGEFARDEVLELLTRALGQDRVCAAGPAVDRIIARCGALPLVIRTVAAKLTVLRHVSLADFADQLDRTDRPLAELAIGDLSPQAGLRRFHDGLSPLARAGLRALGGLPAPPFDQAELLAILPEPAARTLEVLLENNLLAVPDDEVLAHSARYRTPASVHQFAVALHHETETVSAPGVPVADEAGE
ncbi:MAG TPA: BTAD domain-containing putative transcriptional regulator [Pseudonocardiaceae bacterium]|jgi:DNA-binding SARP family transcriptional activator|nr:BTAD domain-containing putative transcriptional regulator [Pseudonocardiaceae bacterium]